MAADSWATCPKCGTVESVREDYWQGIIADSSHYEIEYEAICESYGCTFSLKYRHSIPLKGPKAGTL